MKFDDIGKLGDIGTVGDIGTRSILSQNHKIAYVFFGDIGIFGDIGPPVIFVSLSNVWGFHSEQDIISLILYPGYYIQDIAHKNAKSCSENPISLNYEVLEL